MWLRGQHLESMFAIHGTVDHSGHVGVNRRTSRRTADSDESGAEPALRRGPADRDPLEAELESPVRSLAEEGAVARATTDRLRSEADKAWNRALTATERRDALVTQKHRLIATRRARQAPAAVPETDRSETATPAGSEWAVATMKADVFKALAHPARVRVLDILAAGECSVGRLAEVLGMEISHLSHQLAVLRRSALVDSRREGSVVFYSLRQPQLSQLLGLVAGEMLWDAALPAE